MKVKYDQRVVVANLVVGVGFLLAGVVHLLSGNVHWTCFIYIPAGIVAIMKYRFESRNPYLTIEDGTIIEKTSYGSGQSINLDEITSIEIFYWTYKLNAGERNMKIQRGLVQKDSMIELWKILAELDLDDNPFAKTSSS